MNGIVEVNIEGEKLTLQFGVQACMLFQDMTVKNTLDPLSPENHMKVISDLFYCGLYGWHLRNQAPVLSYAEAMDIFDKVAESPTFKEDQEKIWITYSQSKWGSELISFGKDVKKKLEEIDGQALNQ
jgi:hypothetical protein